MLRSARKLKFEAAVTFFTEFQTQANIVECAVDAALAFFENATTDKAADRFLNHCDQKFRLSYLLGGWRKGDVRDDEDEMSFDEADEFQVLDDEGALTEDQRVANRAVLEKYLSRVGQLAKVRCRQSHRRVGR
jgi:hypothetical protein